MTAAAEAEAGIGGNAGEGTAAEGVVMSWTGEGADAVRAGAARAPAAPAALGRLYPSHGRAVQVETS
jgi:hypothetical protein